ncbi:hypothetical protein METUNv1_01154 [Methyloversatilis universalis FAM5]|uniref:Uncharacterized protein n=1 Tax=Methyloversatilis universalis (strain ATCC BAA-1314 / DSM 25237 / JCM 13912 / CCUG 52030 / FAM5) TaxID=1000565 RepID=F5RA74_METUF|nr:hypothetical protein METUNv1_01154 [Methyloversatilis universalis FAM5]
MRAQECAAGRDRAATLVVGGSDRELHHEPPFRNIAPQPGHLRLQCAGGAVWLRVGTSAHGFDRGG